MNPVPLDGPSLPDGTASTKTIRSMTGYVHQCAQIPLGRLEIEIRAVNSRFSDLHFRLTEECRPLEPRLRKAITACVKRGKVECRLSLQRLHSATPPPLDNNRLAGLLTLVQQIQTQVSSARRRAPLNSRLSPVAAILRICGNHGRPAQEPT